MSSVFARTTTRVNPIETEDCAALSIEMADGALVTLSVTLGGEAEISRLRLYFDGLTVESNHSPYNAGTAPWTFIAADPDRQKAIDAAVAEVKSLPERNTGQFSRSPQGADRGRPDAGIDRRRAAVHRASDGRLLFRPYRHRG